MRKINFRQKRTQKDLLIAACFMILLLSLLWGITGAVVFISGAQNLPGDMGTVKGVAISMGLIFSGLIIEAVTHDFVSEQKFKSLFSEKKQEGKDGQGCL